jgi:hypothetical protein
MFCAMFPAPQYLEDARKQFATLALLSEGRPTNSWRINGEKQSLLEGTGSFHVEGRYILTRVVKRWEGGALFAATNSEKAIMSNMPPRILCAEHLYICQDKFGWALSTSEIALSTVFPGYEVAPW